MGMFGVLDVSAAGIEVNARSIQIDGRRRCARSPSIEHDDESVEREDPTLTFVVCAQGEIHIFKCGDQGQCPEHAREATEYQVFGNLMCSDDEAKRVDG